MSTPEANFLADERGFRLRRTQERINFPRCCGKSGDVNVTIDKRVVTAGVIASAALLVSLLWWLGQPPASDASRVVAAHTAEAPRLGVAGQGATAPAAPLVAQPDTAAARAEPATPSPAPAEAQVAAVAPRPNPAAEPARPVPAAPTVAGAQQTPLATAPRTPAPDIARTPMTQVPALVAPQVAALPPGQTRTDPERRATVIDRTPMATPGTGPTFDIVRVEHDGAAVIAGRASAGCTVTITDADRALGTVRADERGQWVFVPAEPLQPGSREIGLTQNCGNGTPPVLSQQAVLLVVPDRGKDIAGRNAGAPDEVLALVIERDGRGATIPLQVPAAAERSTAKLGVTLDAIDYDQDGRVVLSGRAAPGTQQRIYLENTPIGEATADANGRWTLTPEAPVAPGLYNLRVDQLRADGTVATRIEMPFLRVTPLADLPPGSYVVVQPGNSLWRIARRTYGAGVRYGVIYEANAEQIRDPNIIYPGQIFATPTRR